MSIQTPISAGRDTDAVSPEEALMSPAYFGLVRDVLRDGTLHTRYIAPWAVFNAPHGFGDEVWLDELPDNLLGLRLKGATVRFAGNASAAPRRSSLGANLAVQPKGASTHFTADASVSFAHIYLPDTLLKRSSHDLETAPLVDRLRDDLIFSAPRDLEDSALTYIRRALSVDPPTPLEMEARALLIVDALSRAHTLNSPRAIGGLAPWAKRRCIEMMRERLAEDISLAELAREARLSPFHFARMFKQSVGVAPHAFMVQLRIEKACELLDKTSLSVTEIAQAVGYASSQALNRAFVKAMGTTPSAYRRDMVQ